MLLLKASLFQQSCSAFCTCTPFFYLAKSCISPEKYVRALVTCMEISVPFHFSHNGLNFGPVSPRILTSPVSIVVYSPNSQLQLLMLFNLNYPWVCCIVWSSLWGRTAMPSNKNDSLLYTHLETIPEWEGIQYFSFYTSRINALTLTQCKYSSLASVIFEILFWKTTVVSSLLPLHLHLNAV